jgi:hypothetical protein
MEIAALITWLVTAVGGFVMLGVWLSRGGARAQSRASATAGVGGAGGTTAAATSTPTRLAPPLVFGHFLLAVAGLIVWIIYLVTDSSGLAWTAFVLLLPVAVLGFTMLARWIGAGDHRRGASTAGGRPESHFPLPVVIGHGLFAVATVLLVLLTALGVGES